MPFTQITPDTVIGDYLQKQLEAKETVIINTLKYVGEQCINQARSNGDYMDQTGNLRSSIGYAVVRHGSVVFGSNFKQVKKGSDGVSKGKSFLEELSADSTGIYLVVVAGMNYASYVEAGNMDVITSAELLAESLVPMLLTKLGFKLK